MSASTHVYNLSIERIPPSQLKYKNFLKINLPDSVDLRNKMPPIYDQGQLESCTANALAACFEYQEKNSFIPSRLFMYYNEKVIDNDNSCTNLVDCIRSFQDNGICPENMWPYNVSKFKVKPYETCYNAASKYKSLDVINIQHDITSMKTSLANCYPFIVGISIYESFETKDVANTGLVPIPNINKEELLGGHCVLVCGYDDSKQYWIVRNSWGSLWGDKGYFYLPYLYLFDSKLSSDLWNITKSNIIIEDKLPSFSKETIINNNIPIVKKKICKFPFSSCYS